MSALSIFKRIFPPPNYITLPNVGVDISDTSLKYIQFGRKHSHDKDLELRHWGDLDIPQGALNRGSVSDVAKLSDVLRNVKEECGTEYVRVSLPEERAYLFETTIDHNTPHKEVRSLLEFKLEENVPLSPRDAYFDYDIVSHANKKKDFLVSVAVYSRETITNYYDACVRAGLTPLSFEIEAQAIARAAIPKHLDGGCNAHLILDFGKTRTGIGIVYKRTLMYTSTIDIGGKDLSMAMRGVVGDMPEKEYTKIKNTKGLHNTRDNEVYDVLINAASEIKNEIKTRIQYWQTREWMSGERKIQKIILCGGSSNLAGLPEYLFEELSIPTERIEVWQNAFSLEHFIPPINRRHSYGYSTAVGLAIRDFLS